MVPGGSAFSAYSSSAARPRLRDRVLIRGAVPAGATEDGRPRSSFAAFGPGDALAPVAVATTLGAAG